MFRMLKQMFVRWFRGGRPGRAPDVDPLVGVRVPRHRGPNARGAGVALEEPDPPVAVDALGRLLRKKR